MNIHKNARLTPIGPERLMRQVESRQMTKAVVLAVGVCPRTIRKWVARYRAEGPAGLEDRSSRPHGLRRPTLEERLRRRDGTGKQIAAEAGVSRATVSLFSIG
jgi:transposase